MSQPTPEIDQFIQRIVALPDGPGVSLDAALKPSLEEEAQLREHFASNRTHPALSNPHVGLVDVFAAPDNIRKTRARVVKDDEDLSARYIMPLSEKQRRKEGAPCMVADLEEFKKQWAIFTEGSLSQLTDWNNVVAAGGSVLACLQPLDETNIKTKRSVRKYYHNIAYPTSDLDLFLWGLNAEQAEAKIKYIYEAVRDSVPWDVTCVRTKHTASIHCQFPYRSVQIVLRLYASPAEILAGFDLDAPSVAYDGNRVWANPRAVVAMMRQCNTVDMSRRSSSYEVRLSKYSNRGFEVYVPDLRRQDVDPTIYERAIAKMEGLARLLVLEKLFNTDTRYAFLEDRRQLRGRPDPLNRYNRRKRQRKYKGDLKQEEALGGLDMNDYDVATLHIPYGPGWDAKRIDKLIYQTDLGMNSTFNPKNEGRRLHRHPAFFGTMEEVLEDCCEHCPAPIDDDERKLQTEEDENYIRGRISFFEENPGRQKMSGSFKPIDLGEWSEQVYVKPVQQLFAAIVDGDRPTVQQLLKDGIDVHQRDHVGRTPLHVAIIAKQTDIACDIIDADARMIARLADGRTCLHLAAQMDLPVVVRKLFEKSAKNQEEVDKKTPKDADEDDAKMKDGTERPSSEDDWSSHDDDDVDMVEDEDLGDDEDDEEGGRKKKKNAGKEEEKEKVVQDGTSGDLPEDEEDEPDIINVDEHDWDAGFTALAYAVLFASPAVIDELLANKADPKLSTNNTRYPREPLHPLTLCLLRPNEDEACEVAERLIKAGATASTANGEMRTILHQIVARGHAKLLATVLRTEAGASSVLNFPAIRYDTFLFPVSTAVSRRHYAALAVLLAYGAKIQLQESDCTHARDVALAEKRNFFGYGSNISNYLDMAAQPVELALSNRDDIVQLLISIGATIDVGLQRSLARYSDEYSRRTIASWVEYALHSITSSLDKEETVVVTAKDATPEPVPQEPNSHWHRFIQQYISRLVVPVDPEVTASAAKAAAIAKEERVARLKEAKEYLEEVSKFLKQKGAKEWDEVYPHTGTKAVTGQTKFAPVFVSWNDPVPGVLPKVNLVVPPSRSYRYDVYINGYSKETSPEHKIALYDELFEACYTGDNATVQRLCLAPEGATGASPLNIHAVYDRGMKFHGYSNYDNNYNYTPLFAAIAGRRWSTAKLILAIAAGQYHPGNDEKALRWKDDDGNDSDGGSDYSGASEDTVEQPEFKFVDIATRPSSVQLNIHPSRFLQYQAPWRKGKYEHGNCNVLMKAVIDNDFEAFVQIANLYDTFPEPYPIESTIIDKVLQDDKPEMLDECIRRTGVGIDIKIHQAETGEAPIPSAVNDANRLYLGLNVHGKKRADLARKNDPNAGSDYSTPELPLLWRAASNKAVKVIEYLGTDKAVEAFKFYGISHSNEKAIWLRRQTDLAQVLPTLLGWKVNGLGESPLAAGVMSGDLKTLKTIIAKCPQQLISSTLHLKFKFSGANLLSLAVSKNSGTEIIDFLLSRGVSPADRDNTKMYNIYHAMASQNEGDKFEYFLNKLPRDVNEALLRQTTKDLSYTPLHIAVKKGAKRIVKLILDYSLDTLVAIDVNAQTPLHLAVKASYPEITRMLVEKMDGKGLRMENGVGNTAEETIGLCVLNERVQSYCQSINVFPDAITPNSEVSAHGFRYQNADSLITKAQELRSTVASLLAQGRLKNQTQLTSELNNFAALLETRAQNAKATYKELKERNKLSSESSELPPYKDALDGIDQGQTHEILLEALKKKPAPRQLVHLFDVQKSVAANLSKVGSRDNTPYYLRPAAPDGLAEEEEVVQERGHGLLPSTQTPTQSVVGMSQSSHTPPPPSFFGLPTLGVPTTDWQNL